MKMQLNYFWLRLRESGSLTAALQGILGSERCIYRSGREIRSSSVTHLLHSSLMYHHYHYCIIVIVINYEYQ